MNGATKSEHVAWTLAYDLMYDRGEDCAWVILFQLAVFKLLVAPLQKGAYGTLRLFSISMLAFAALVFFMRFSQSIITAPQAFCQ